MRKDLPPENDRVPVPLSIVDLFLGGISGIGAVLIAGYFAFLSTNRTARLAVFFFLATGACIAILFRQMIRPSRGSFLLGAMLAAALTCLLEGFCFIRNG